jgi:hypothetical protein
MCGCDTDSVGSVITWTYPTTAGSSLSAAQYNEMVSKVNTQVTRWGLGSAVSTTSAGSSITAALYTGAASLWADLLAFNAQVGIGASKTDFVQYGIMKAVDFSATTNAYNHLQYTIAVAAATCPCNCNAYCSSNSCFIAGSLVTMANGSDKPIEQVAVGDVVYSYDVPNKEFGTGVVHAVQDQENRNYSLTLSDETKIGMTGNHPIFTTHGWAAIEPQNCTLPGATQLSVGDSVMRIDSTYLTVSSIVPSEELVSTYTLVDVENFDTFFVNNILVHNKTCFLGGTRIAMADGTFKNIEHLIVGDCILTFNEEDGTKGTHTLQLMHSVKRDHINHVVFADGRVLKITYEHSMLTDQGWKCVDPTKWCPDGDTTEWNVNTSGPGFSISALEVGDKVLNLDGDYVPVVSIETHPGVVRVYSLLHITGNRSYYAEGTVVGGR